MPNVTLTIDAQNWIGALRSGLKSIGEGQDAIANVMCDIKEDNSIHVTDVATRRVFRLREIPAKAPASAGDAQAAPEAPRAISSAGDVDETIKNVRAPEFDAAPRTLIEFPVPKVPSPSVALNALGNAPTVQLPHAPAPVPPQSQATTTASAASGAPVVSTPLPKTKTIPPTPRGVPAPAPKRPSGQFSSAAEPKSREVTAPQPTDPRIGRPPTASQAAAVTKGGTPIDVQDAIAAVFDATQDLYMETSLSPQRVADTLLDIALRHIPAESGTFYLADVNGHELEFAAVRGPKADALKKSGVTVKVGQGIIGFCAQEGVCLVVSDIQKDPRYYASIARTIDYQPRDTLCASAEKDGRLWGAVQLINSNGGFEAAHMEVLRFIGLTAAAMLERIDDRG